MEILNIYNISYEYLIPEWNPHYGGGGGEAELRLCYAKSRCVKFILFQIFQM